MLNTLHKLNDFNLALVLSSSGSIRSSFEKFPGIRWYNLQVFPHEGHFCKTMNKAIYTDILRRLSYAVRRKRPEKWRTNSWFPLQDNAPAHRSVLVKYFLVSNYGTTLEYLPYSTDLDPANFYIFP